MAMSIDIWTPWGQLAFLPPTALEYAVLGVCILLGIALMIHSRQNSARPSWPRLALLFALILAALAANNLLVIRFSDARLLPPPGIPARQRAPIVPLLGALPIAFAGAWLGPGPALLVGIATALARGVVAQSSILEPIYFAAYGFLAGSFLRRPYSGRLTRVLRQPLVAVPFAAALALPAQFMSAYVPVWLSGLSGLDFAANATWARTGPLLAQALLAGVAVQLAYVAARDRRPAPRTDTVPPGARSLFRRQTVLLGPMFLAAVAVFLLVSGRSALRVAERTAVDGMARTARSAAAQTPYFVQTGKRLVSALASDERWQGNDPSGDAETLQRGFQAVPFFDQLILTDGTGNTVSEYPKLSAAEGELSSVERRLVAQALGSDTVQISGASLSGSGTAYLAFVAPIPASGGDGSTSLARALVGRTRLDTNPVVALVRKALDSTHDQAEAFVVDAQERVVIHSDPSLLVTEWNTNNTQTDDQPGGGEWSAETRSPRDGTRQLVYTAPVEGLPWRVVILLPYSVVAGQAALVAGPTFLALLGLGLGLAIVSLAATRSVSRPLLRLAADANRIASGDLTRPVAVRGDDEVDAVAQALERMRIMLKGRLDHLSLLLDLNRSASSTLDVRQGLAHVLEGALSATQAQVARAVLLSADGRIETAVGRGEVRHGVRQLDQALVQAVGERSDPFQVDDVSEVLPSLRNVERGEGLIRRAVVAPVRSAGLLTAIIWIGYRTLHRPDSASLDVLSSLADQTATLIETSRSYRSAEDERRLLAGILESSSDGLLVTDRAGRIVRCSRAAEGLLGVSANTVLGREVNVLDQHPAVAEMFRVPLVKGQAATAEVSIANGRICTCSVFLIIAEDGDTLGRVMTLRDITTLRDLEASRSRFIDRLSHEIRRPLTLIHGHATMLARGGSLSAQQRGFVINILRSVEQTGRLVQGLQDMEGLDTAVSSDRRSVVLGSVVRVSVAGADVAARGKGVFLRTGALDLSTVVTGDEAQLQGAVDALLDEAIRIAPPGSAVRIDLETVGAVVNLSIATADRDDGDTARSGTSAWDEYAEDHEMSLDSPLRPELAAVRSIAEGHGGELRIRPRQSGGATFTLALPYDVTAQRG